jgi:hypothetical protein
MSKRYYPILPTILVYKIFEYKIDFELAQKKEDEINIFKKIIQLYPNIPDDYIQELESKMYYSLSKFGKNLQKFKEKNSDERYHEFKYDQRIEQEKENLNICIDNFDKNSKIPIKIANYDFDFDEEDNLNVGMINFFESYIRISTSFAKIEKVNKNNSIARNVYIKIFDYNEYMIHFQSIDFPEYITIVDEEDNEIEEIHQYETVEKNIYWVN